MDSKKIIKKLIKIANNQQKIITKLAQNVGMINGESESSTDNRWDASNEISIMLAQIPEALKTRASVQSAIMYDSGFLQVKIKFPNAQLINDKNASLTLSKLRKELKNAFIRKPNGRLVSVRYADVIGIYG